MTRTKPIRVLVVDDSAAVRKVMKEVLSADPEIEVIGAASDPFMAARLMRDEVPDVITLDVEMPRMDGITFLRKLMAQHPIPVVICSSLVGDNSETMLQALEAGAVDFVCKPQMGVGQFLHESHDRLRQVIKAAAMSRPGKLRGRPPIEAKLTADAILPPMRAGTAMARTTERIVAIGASTGGTEALRAFLCAMPEDCPGIVIVQHMPEHFTAAFAKRLDGLTRITVREAKDGDRLLRGLALIAPGNRHTVVVRSGATYKTEIREGPLVSRHRPSADVLFRSVARAAGRNAVGLIMTGMGDDGARGLKEMRDAGARTLGQNEESCVVYGMPKEALRLGAVEEEVHLDDLPNATLRLAASH